jgi:hypothetical protein
MKKLTRRRTVWRGKRGELWFAERQVEVASVGDPSYKYEQLYSSDHLLPNEIAAGLATPFSLHTYGIPPDGKYSCLLKILSENGKPVQARFWLVVTNRGH